jgi:hypothetical protein
LYVLPEAPPVNVRSVLPRDAIPSIDDPEFAAGYVGDPDDEVIVIDGTPPKAYPIRILNYHEIVNDVVDGPGESTPVAVTWCPLCGSAVAYDRRVTEGATTSSARGAEDRPVDDRTLTFGVSGKLADDDLVMYDRETDSEWKQSLGECIAGELAGTELEVLPASVSTYAAFERQHPDGLVLQPTTMDSEAASDTDEPASISYDERPYADYFDGDGFGLAAHRGEGDQRTWDRDDIDPKTVVLGVEVGDEAVGFPRPRVADAGGVVTARVGDRDVVVFATDDGVHAFENPGLEFAPGADGFRADGVEWDGAAGESADGRTLERIPSRRLFAFAWRDDHGEDAFFRPEE